jgi:hypothetical protein
VYLLDVEPLDLGPDVRAVGLELTEADENREPVRGPEAARVWSRVLRATAADEIWALDFFSHLDRVREYCNQHQVKYREAGTRSIVIPAPDLPAHWSHRAMQCSKESWRAVARTLTMPLSKIIFSALSADLRMPRSFSSVKSCGLVK